MPFDKFFDAHAVQKEIPKKNLEKLVKPQQLEFCSCGNQISSWAMWKEVIHNFVRSDDDMI